MHNCHFVISYVLGKMLNVSNIVMENVNLFYKRLSVQKLACQLLCDIFIPDLLDSISNPLALVR